MSRKILIVDDSKFTRRMVETPLQRDGFTVATAGSPDEAIIAFRNDRPDLVITDLKMPTLIDGLGFLEMLGAEDRDIPVLVYTADPDPASTVGQTGLRQIRYIQKPVAPELLRQEIDQLL